MYVCKYVCMYACMHVHAYVHSQAQTYRALVGQAGVGVAELIEEGVGTRVHGRDAFVGSVLQQLAHQVNGLGRGFGLEHTRPRVRLDLRELELGVVRIHRFDLLTRWRAHNLDDFHQLVHIALPRKQWLNTRVASNVRLQHTNNTCA